MTQIIVTNSSLSDALVNAVHLWAYARTDSNARRYADLLRDKCAALLADGDHGTAAGFFARVQKPLTQITPLDVHVWQDYMQDMNLTAGTIYSRVSRLSSFYEWLMSEPSFRDHITANPVRLARPRAPRAYQTRSTQALNDDEARELLAVVREAALTDNLAAKRDYALLRFYFATGKRREEIIGLRWGDLQFSEDVMIVQTREKGGLYRASEVRDSGVKAALWVYLRASQRWDTAAHTPLLEADCPLWLRHDRAARPLQAITSHGFVKAFKAYAKAAGLGDIHLHQTRHTVARLVGEQSGSLSEVQAVLGHQNQSTTRVYLDRIAIKRDRHSENIARRLLGEE